MSRRRNLGREKEEETEGKRGRCLGSAGQPANHHPANEAGHTEGKVKTTQGGRETG